MGDYTDLHGFPGVFSSLLLFLASSLPFVSPSHLLTLLPSVFAALPFPTHLLVNLCAYFHSRFFK